MKLEIDLSNRTELLRARKEHATALGIIDLALRSLEDSGSKRKGDVFEQLPHQFTIRELKAKNYTRDRARSLIATWIEENRIKLVEEGVGKAPHLYEKIHADTNNSEAETHQVN